ncbi:MAG: MFS transporter [Candidatus Eisenbacteria bacterium]|uniref:MFS transporter n=1 Tax=Eiseniibacteriota bacterium TaxID=2212470 RepID=A0A538U1D8_UNCEI|nr:MAG: MFS transporter [Candidatus Eisenbacteria bacterium]
MNDRRVLYATAFLRALATGMIGVLLGFYLADRRLDSRAIGIIVAAGLFGAAVATLLITAAADRFGRRRALVAIALLSTLGGLALLVTSHPLALALAAFVGMVNGMGRDRGAALVLEQAVLPNAVTDHERTFAFARYNVAQDVGHALGGLLAAAPHWIQRAAGPGATASFGLRAAVLAYAALSLVPVLLYPLLSAAAESTARTAQTPPLSPATRRILWKLGSLFALDGLGGGFLTATLLSYFFHERFGVGIETVGPLFFGARVANALSHLGAAWLARRIGLVNTMVFTHMPSILLLVTVAFAPSFPVAAIFFLLREGLVEMDVPTRQSYVMAVVKPEERTRASGVTAIVRLGAWAAAPTLAGFLMQGLSLMTPLIVGAVMKITYDVLLWRSFRRVRPPEEQGEAQVA